MKVVSDYSLEQTKRKNTLFKQTRILEKMQKNKTLMINITFFFLQDLGNVLQR